MNLWRSLNGQTEVKLTSADITGAMDAVTGLGIPIRQVMYVDELTVHFTLDRRDYIQVKKLSEKRGESLGVLRRTGLYWTVSGLGKRPFLAAGLLAAVFLTFYLPTRVLFIRVEGNETIPERQILAEAENCGIRFGASRRKVRSEQMKNALLSSVPDLQWAGVNTAGCVATISVRERSEGEPEKKFQTREVSSIVADRDGVVLTCTVTAGSGQCTPGQAVREGQVLISGYTDCGLLLQATRAEGEILAQTSRHLTVKSLCERRFRGPVRDKTRQYSLIVGKKRINFANSSRICDTNCGRMYEEYYITLPGGFRLPVALAVQTHICCETRLDSSEPETMESALTAYARKYLTGQMVSGSIEKAACLYRTEDGACILDADFLCREMIGRRVQEGKGNGNGESD